MAQLLSVAPMLDLDAHRKEIGPALFATALPTSPFSQPGQASKAESPLFAEETSQFVTAIDGTYPPPALLPEERSEGRLQDARLGSAFSAIEQLTDLPEWLVQTDSQQSIESTVSQLESESGDQKSGGDCRELLRRGSETSQAALHTASLACTTAFIGYMRSLPADRGHAFLAGAFSSQLALNAAYFRNEETAAMLLRVLSSFDELDALLPAFGSERSKAKGILSKDWTAQFHLGLELTKAITS